MQPRIPGCLDRNNILDGHWYFVGDKTELNHHGELAPLASVFVQCSRSFNRTDRSELSLSILPVSETPIIPMLEQVGILCHVSSCVLQLAITYEYKTNTKPYEGQRHETSTDGPG
jgi:hypothetical protein